MTEPAINPWRTRLPMLIGTHTVGTVNIVAVLALAPVISLELQLSAKQFGFFLTAYYGAQAVGSLPAGAITDRYGIARTLIASHVVMAVAAVLLFAAVGYGQCLVALFLMGIGYSMTNPATSRAVLDWFPRQRRGTAMGLKQVGVPIGGVMAAAAGAAAADVHWQTIMLAIAGLIAASGVTCLFLLRVPFTRPPVRRGSARAGMREVLRDSNVTVYAVINGLTNIGQANFFGFLTRFLTESAIAGQQTASFALGLAQASSAIARIGWGWASDFLFAGARKWTFVLIIALAVVFMVLMPVAILGGGGWGLWLALGLAIFLGATIASFAPVAQAIAVEMTEPRLAGSAMGCNMVGVYIGGMAGPPIFGAIVDATGAYAASWLATAGVTFVGLILLIARFKERKNDTEVPTTGVGP